MQTTLYYAHDPMCSWCWAYAPTWRTLREALSGEVEIQPLLGGLAPDTDEPMPAAMQQKLQSIWRQIQTHVPGTRFNFDFWKRCHPRRATYPACRAVIAAAGQGRHWYAPMTEAIQQAYYLDARNPSEDDTLIALAVEIGLDGDRFGLDLNSGETRAELMRQVGLCRNIGLDGFPGLVLRRNGGLRQIQVEMNDAEAQVALIRDAAARAD